MSGVDLLVLCRRKKARATLNAAYSKVFTCDLDGLDALRSSMLRAKTEALVRHDRIIDGFPRLSPTAQGVLLGRVGAVEGIPFWQDLKPEWFQ